MVAKTYHTRPLSRLFQVRKDEEEVDPEESKMYGPAALSASLRSKKGHLTFTHTVTSHSRGDR